MLQNNIFISIASYRDTQLLPTVTSFLENAKYPQRLFFSICSQDYDDLHPNLENIIKFYNANMFYKKIHPKDSRGVGYARSICQQNLDLSFDYYLQVDSHTQCLKHWDEILINDYNFSKEKYNNFIYSSYPSAWFFQDGLKHFLGVSDNPSVIVPKFEKDTITKFKSTQKNIDMVSPYGYESNWFCAGFAFGKSEYFLQVPYDQYMIPFSNIGFGSAEEFSLSVRFFENNISLITPPGQYFWHLYDGGNTKKSVGDEIDGINYEDMKKNIIELEQYSSQRIIEFYNGSLESPYGIKDIDVIINWFKKSEMSNDIIKKVVDYFKDGYVI